MERVEINLYPRKRRKRKKKKKGKGKEDSVIEEMPEIF